MLDIFKKSIIFFYLMIFLLSCSAAVNGNDQSAQPVINPDQYKGLSDLQNNVHSIAKNQGASVVLISTEKTVVQNYTDPFNFFFGNPFNQYQRRNQPQQKLKETALGSGVIFEHQNDKYYIITNNHVIANADSIQIKVDQNKSYKGKLLGADPNIDIAVVEITTRDKLVIAKLGDSANVQVGDFVVAVGNPFGLNGTYTFGIISAIGRTNIQTDNTSLTDFIQTDASINPGNSGGPLINIQGEVIGINTLIYSQSGGSIGIGFAIPVNIAKNTAIKIINKGSVEHGYLGIYYKELTKDDINTLGYKNIEEGMLVTQVVKNSPAEKAGLKSGDVIIKVDGKNLSNSNDLAIIIGNKDPGTKVTFSILSNNKMEQKTVTLGKRTEQSFTQQKQSEQQDNNSNNGVYLEKYGMTVAGINADTRKQYNLSSEDQGVVITGIYDNSPAQANQLLEGDIIYKINDQIVHNPNDVVKISKEDRDKNYFFIKRNNMQFIVVM